MMQTNEYIVMKNRPAGPVCSAFGGVQTALDVEGVRARVFNPADTLYLEWQEASVVYMVKSGLVKLISYLPNGRARIVRLHGSGSLVGLSGLLEPRYEHTAVAVGRVEADAVPVSSLIRLRSDDPTMYCRLLEEWYGQLQTADTWITQFSTGSIRARVARLVNYLSEIEQKSPSNEVELLTCEEMAAVLGVTPESVSRILAEFKRDQMLRSVRRTSSQCFERNVEALKQVALD